MKKILNKVVTISLAILFGNLFITNSNDVFAENSVKNVINSDSNGSNVDVKDVKNVINSNLNSSNNLVVYEGDNCVEGSVDRLVYHFTPNAPDKKFLMTIVSENNKNSVLDIYKNKDSVLALVAFKAGTQEKVIEEHMGYSDLNDGPNKDASPAKLSLFSCTLGESQFVSGQKYDFKIIDTKQNDKLIMEFKNVVVDKV